MCAWRRRHRAGISNQRRTKSQPENWLYEYYFIFIFLFFRVFVQHHMNRPIRARHRAHSCMWHATQKWEPEPENIFHLKHQTHWPYITYWFANCATWCRTEWKAICRACLFLKTSRHCTFRNWITLRSFWECVTKSEVERRIRLCFSCQRRNVEAKGDSKNNRTEVFGFALRVVCKEHALGDSNAR